MKLIFILLAICFSASAIADTDAKGHTRKDGTYVQGHTRSSPDAYRSNNIGSQSKSKTCTPQEPFQTL